MADRTLKLRELKQILARYDVQWDPAGGKGSHGRFVKTFADGTYTYPIPTHGTDVLVCYVRGARRKFRLHAEDGVSDKEFYGG